MDYLDILKKVSASLVVGVGLTCAVGTAFAQDKIVLTYSNWLPPSHVIQKFGIEPLIADVERVTEGRVRIEPTPKVVGTLPSQYDIALDGVTDISLSVLGYTPGRFPLTEFIELPFLSDDTEAVNAALWRVYEEDLKSHNEFDGVHILSIHVAAPGQIATRNATVTEMSGLSGLRMRNPLASFVPAVEAMGAVPVNRPMSELYELAAQGVVDGTFAQVEAMLSFKLADVLPHLTLIEGGFYSPAQVLAINNASWEKVSEADRAAIMEVAGEHMGRQIGKAYNDIAVKALEDLTAQGVTIHTADEKFMSDLKQALAFMEESWIKNAQASGLEDPLALIAKTKALIVELSN